MIFTGNHPCLCLSLVCFYLHIPLLTTSIRPKTLPYLHPSSISFSYLSSHSFLHLLIPIPISFLKQFEKLFYHSSSRERFLYWRTTEAVFFSITVLACNSDFGWAWVFTALAQLFSAVNDMGEQPEASWTLRSQLCTLTAILLAELAAILLAEH